MSVFLRSRAVGSKALGRFPAKRGVEILSDDVVLVSYPRSGSTWMRFLISNLIYQDDPTTFLNLEHRFPDIYINSPRALKRLGRPRYLKSHEYFDPRYQKVVYLVRDPIDVALSYFRYSIKLRTIPPGYPMEDYVRRFLRGEWDTYGTWAEHVGGWWGARHWTENFLWVKYEEVLSRPLEELARIAEFLGIPTQGDVVQRSIESSRADRMRVIEKREASEWKTTQYSLLDRPFVGSATSGRGRAELSADSQEAISRAWGTVISEFGYDSPGESGEKT